MVAENNRIISTWIYMDSFSTEFIRRRTIGTINYNISDYITLAIKPYDFRDIEEDLKDCYPEDEVDDDMVYATIDGYYVDDAETAESIIDKYNLWYYHVTVKPGYYEGLSIDIELNYPLYYDDYQDKREALRETTKLKQLLKDLAGIGFVDCWSGWYTKFFSYEETLVAINQAINEIREDVKHTPTWKTYGF